MDLNKILKKTQSRNKCVELIRQRPSIATEDRPYLLDVTNHSNKFSTNQPLTGHKPNTELNTNQTQSGYKPDTNQTQTENILNTNQTQSGHKVDTKLDTQPDTNQTQTRHKLDTKSQLSTIVGLQKAVLHFLYFSCKKNMTITTEPLTKEYIASSLNIPTGSIKTTIQRLEQKKYITFAEFKNGRSGWSRYKLSDAIYKELLEYETRHKPDTNWTQTGHKLNTELNTELDTTPLNNSSIYNNKIIITNDAENLNNLPSEWESINYESLRNIQFSRTQLLQLYSKKLNTPEIIQESINHFAFGLENSEKTKSYKNPLLVLMGVLRKGEAWTEDNYESATDKALRLLLERRKEVEESRNKIYNEFFNLEYNKWFNKISDEELKRLLPKADFKYGKYIAEIENQARVAFRQTKWEEIYEEIKKQTEK